MKLFFWTKLDLNENERLFVTERSGYYKFIFYHFYALIVQIKHLDKAKWMCSINSRPNFWTLIKKNPIQIFTNHHPTMVGISNFCPKIITHFCLLNLWKCSLSRLHFYSFTKFVPFTTYKCLLLEYFSKGFKGKRLDHFWMKFGNFDHSASLIWPSDSLLS